MRTNRRSCPRYATEQKKTMIEIYQAGGLNSPRFAALHGVNHQALVSLIRNGKKTEELSARPGGLRESECPGPYWDGPVQARACARSRIYYRMSISQPAEILAIERKDRFPQIAVALASKFCHHPLGRFHWRLCATLFCSVWPLFCGIVHVGRALGTTLHCH